MITITNQAIETTTSKYAINALEKKCFFKLVCGASLTDTQMIENLSFIFTLAGAHVIDLAPSADVIFAARRGIEKALSYLEKQRHEARNTNHEEQISFLLPASCFLPRPPLLMASIQLDKDPHFRKAQVNYDSCDLCSACVQICPTEAFKIEDNKFIYSVEKCFGCGICPSYCHVSALSMLDTNPTPIETFQEMVLLGVEAVEFHFGENFHRLEEIWDQINNLRNKSMLFSFSIGSGLLSDKQIKNAANLCFKLAGKGIILQCDGTPMSGGNNKNGNNKDNPSLQVAKLIEEENLPVYLQISGGTNENSFAKAKEAKININGVAIGSYARKLLMPYLSDLNDKVKFKDAANIARSLVNSVGNCEVTS